MYIHTYMCKYVRTYIHTYTCVITSVCVCLYMLVCSYVCVNVYMYEWYSSSLTLHSHVKSRVLSPAFCVELLNISQVINIYLQFCRACVCIFFKECTCVHEHTLYDNTQNCMSTLTCSRHFMSVFRNTLNVYTSHM